MASADAGDVATAVTAEGAPQELLSIGEVSERIGLSAHTLRFYEQQELFLAPVRRDPGGRRAFTAEEVEWLLVCTRLRSSGMPLAQMRRYAQLVADGPGNEAKRIDLLREHEHTVRAQVAELQDALAIIQNKVKVYSALQQPTATTPFS